MGLSEELFEVMSSHNLFSINLPGGYAIPVTDTVVIMWMVMTVMILIGFIFSRNLQKIPTGKQNVAEFYIEFINNLSHTSMGHHGHHFAPYLGTVLLFLIFSNTISIFNVIPSSLLYDLTGIQTIKHFGLRPPTRDINVTACLALMSITLVLLAGIKIKKMGGFLKSFIEPVAVILPFKILDYFIRPLSLSLRLFGNILGAFIVMELLYMAMPAFIPAICSVYFDLFDGLLQAYVFVFLTSLYIGEAIE